MVVNLINKHKSQCLKIIDVLKRDLKKIKDIKLAFVIGSYNKKYFSICSDLDIIIILDEEKLDTIIKLKTMRTKLKQAYKVSIDFMINNIRELNINYPMGELNNFVITNFNQNKYTVLVNNLSEKHICNKPPLESIILDSRYYFNKLRFILLNESFFIRDVQKKVVGYEKTKISVSTLFNLVRRYILLKCNLYVEEYEDVINIIKKESLQDSKQLELFWKLKINKQEISNAQFKKLYDLSKKIYFEILQRNLGESRCQKKWLFL